MTAQDLIQARKQQIASQPTASELIRKRKEEMEQEEALAVVQGENFLDRTVRAFKGQSEFDFPEIRQAAQQFGLPTLGRENRERSTRFLQLTDDLSTVRSTDDIRTAVQKNFPEARFRQDRFGNPFVTLPEGDFFLNQSGFSSEDVSQGITEGIVIGAGAVPAAGLAGKVLGGAGRVLGAGTGAGLSSAGFDVARGAPVDVERAFELGALTSAFEAGIIGVGVLAGLARNGLARIFGSRGTFKDGALTPAASREVESLGIAPESVTPETANRFMELLRQTDDPAAAFRQAEANTLPEEIVLTGGQATRVPSRLLRESEAKKGVFGEDIAAEGVARQEATQAALRDNIEAVSARLAGQRQVQPGQASEEAQAALLRARTTAKRGIDEAFEVARAGKAWLPAREVPKIGNEIRQALNSFDIAGLPRASSLLENFNQLNTRATRVSIRGLETWRKRLVKAERGAASPEEREALRRMRGAFDDIMESRLKDGLFTGDEGAIQAWRNARSLRAQFGKTFEQDDIVRELTVRMRDGSRRLKVEPADAINYIFGRGRIGARRGITRDLKKLKNVLGEGSPEWQGLRADAFLHFFRNSTGPNFPAGVYARQLDLALKTSPEAMNILFTKPQIALLQQLKRVGVNVTAKPNIVGNVNASNTAAATWIRRAKNGFGPIGEIIGNRVEKLIAGRGRSDARFSFRGELPRRPNPTLPRGAGSVPATATDETGVP